MIIIDQIYLVREQKVTAEPILLLCPIHSEFIYINRGTGTAPARDRMFVINGELFISFSASR
jgi:hypothetical protein